MRKVYVHGTNRADFSPLATVRKMLGEHYTDNPYEADVALVLGDQADTLRTVVDLTQLRIPIAHCHGGETTLGSYDNRIRDAITMLSHLHFAATEKAMGVLREIVFSGEDNIWLTGAPGIDNIESLPKERKDLPPYFVVTYHPATLADEDVSELVEALSNFSVDAIWTPPNRDPGWEKVLSKIPKRHVMSGQEYLLACRDAALVIGNSSSGIVEVPSLRTPTLDVGDRQKGRERGPSVHHCPMKADEIVEAIKAAMNYKGSYQNPYHRKGASKMIVSTLLGIDLDGVLVA